MLVERPCREWQNNCCNRIRQKRTTCSFVFFWRKTGDRDDINKLVATLAYQIARKIPLAKEGMEENLRLTNDQEPLTVLSDRLSKSSLEDRLSKRFLSTVP